MDAKSIWLIVEPFIILAIIAWIALMKKQYDLAMEDKKLTWWEARCLFIEGVKMIPSAILSGFKGFPFGSLLRLLLKIPAGIKR